MQDSANPRNPILRVAVGVVALGLSALSCGREPAAPVTDGTSVRFSHALHWKPVFPAAYQLFQASGGGAIVEFTKVRIVLNNPDGSIAIDTVVSFPAGSTELTLTLSVPLPASAPATGQPLALNLDYQNAAGETVFHGGPVTVNAVPKTPGGGPPPPAPVTIPISYTGPGANAVAVQISPQALSVNTGATFAFSARAVDAAGNVVPNTPIVFVSDNQLVASINAATGAGVAGSARGSVGITAQLLTGPTDAATLTIVSPPSGIAAVSGSGQTAPVGTALPQPVVVKVTASDGLGAPDVAVTFAAANGGSVGSATVTTGADGIAQTTWKLGTTVGTQTLTASAAGLSGSPVTFTATGRSIEPVRLAFGTEPPPSTASQATIAPAVVVNALDAAGAVATGFTGPLTLTIGGGAPVGALLSGTTTVNAVAGVATFGDLRLNKAGTYTLVAAAGSLVPATSSSFQIVPGPATRLVFQNYPVAGAVAGTPLDPVTVSARDEAGNQATSFTGAVTLSSDEAASLMGAAGRGSIPATDATTGSTAFPVPASIAGTTTVNAIAGLATFSDITLQIAGTRTLFAGASGLGSFGGPSFTVSAGAAAQITLRSGGAQFAPPGTALPLPIQVQTSDSYGNAVGGITVNFAPSGGGVANPSSAVTSGSGTAQTAWTLGPASGVQTLTVTGSGLGSLSVTAQTTSGGSGSTGEFIVLHDVNWADNSYGNGAGNVQFKKNLVNFTIGGARAAANKVMLVDFGTLSYYNFSSNWSVFAATLLAEGYTGYNTTNRANLVSVPADVKVVILHVPSGSFTTSEVNGIKSFLAQGGRVLYIGENSGFQYTLNAANALLATMGATTGSSGACVYEALPTITAHQLTAGTTGFTVNCASKVIPGSGDQVLMRDGSGNAIVVIANVNTTLIPAGSLVGGSIRVPDAPGPVVAQPGVDATLGPMPRKPPR